jgi:PKD repeat protein
MTSVTSSDLSRRSTSAASLLAGHVARAASILLLCACGEPGIVDPIPTETSGPGQPAAGVHTAVVVTPNYSAFDTRTEFNAAGIVDHITGFEEFTGDLVYVQPTPWTSNGVTYTSALNLILGPAVGFGVASNVMSTEFGSPLSGELASGDAFTLFGADLSIFGDKVPVSLVLSTNVRTYSFSSIDVPSATSGHRFFGVALSGAGEYLTGFRFSIAGSESTLLLDDVAVGHVATRNADPEATAGGPYVGLEGSAIALSLAGTDADGDALTFSWNLGDGTTGSGPTPPSTHVYADNGSYDIRLIATDGRGGVDTARTTATISNVAPVLEPFAVPTAPMPLTPGGVTLPISTTFSDPGTLDTHSSTLDCGAGPTIQSNAPNGTAAGTCTFTSPGVYTVRLTVIDKDGGSDARLASGQVVVYDATARWVTGGGWITSPAGANTAAPSTTSKLTFAFVARYLSSTTPTGNAEFKLNVGKVDFRSTSLDWLILSGNTARLQGRGTFNGNSDYAFILVASDGAPSNAIRIRIWNRVTGSVVYDNQPGAALETDIATPLSGGSIQLHER